MKQNLHSVALLLTLVLLITTSQSLARLLATKQGEEGPTLSKITSRGSVTVMEEDDSMNQLMGMEDCRSGDEECLKRRMVAEAHLDYIYTQHLKP